MLKLVLFFWGFGSGIAHAQNEGEWNLISEFLLASTYHERAESSFNPSNRVLQVPNLLSTAEYRPDLSYSRGDFRAVARGRLIFEHSNFQFENPSEKKERSKGRSDLSDAFVDWRVSDQSTLVLGLQNYQWGPAELFSPTNPFFHFNTQQKSFFYKEKGHVLARGSFDLSDQLSFVAMLEPISNNDTGWTAEREFNAKSLLKLEYKATNPADYLAFVTGVGEFNRPFMGEYFNHTLKEGVSFYLDARHTQGNTRLPLLPENESLDRWYTLLITGLRYEGESFDLRQEFLYNEAGYSKDDWDRVRSLVLTPALDSTRKLARFARPGLEFMTQSYSYTSLRIPDLGKKDDINLYLRYLHAMTDGSGVLQINGDKIWNDSVVLYLEALLFQGEEDTEFHISDDYQASLGLRLTL